jgi:serine/threonine protein kinase
MCKIGDFGLIKQLVSLYPVENSPFTQEKEKLKANLKALSNDPVSNDNNQMSQVSKESSSDASYSKENRQFNSDTESHITKNIGTRMYASPEQWMADKDTFDYRADIFSLGITFLLLFYPMSTYMERTNTINESKEGNIPEGLAKDLPEIAEIIKKMISLDPISRPSIEKILHSLKLPSETKPQLCGRISFRKENALRWRKKYFKLIDGNLHLYSRENDKKAENIYNLPHWRVTLQENKIASKYRVVTAKDESHEDIHTESSQFKPKEMHIKIENHDQLGCELKPENSKAAVEIFKAFEEFKGAC